MLRSSRSLLLVGALGLALAGCSSKSDNTKEAPGGDTGADGDQHGDTVPATWTCAESNYGDISNVCDCGCGIADPNCGTGGCATPGCQAPGCQSCKDVDGTFFACNRPVGWTCGPWESEDNTCDCGCSARDPNCEAGKGCEGPDCTADGCERCHDAQGRRVSCAHTGWLCDDDDWGGTRCDCGCGIADPACNGTGCTEPGCKSNYCYFCHDENGMAMSCAPSTWTCPTEYFDYSTSHQCDCGCGAVDPFCLPGTCMEPDNGACAPLGCTEAGCDDSHCALCHLADGRAFNCGNPPPAGWTCAPMGYLDTESKCDCGCGADDPACGTDGCIAGGCDTGFCDRCHLANGTEFRCGALPPTAWTCDPMLYGDGNCDCGCGDLDLDCQGSGCATVGCSEASCIFCYDSLGRAYNCAAGVPPPAEWTCETLNWGNGECDCGCHAVDVDCGTGGCASPDCREATCYNCYDREGDFHTCD